MAGLSTRFVNDILRGVGYNGCLSIVYEGQSDPIEIHAKEVSSAIVK